MAGSLPVLPHMEGTRRSAGRHTTPPFPPPPLPPPAPSPRPSRHDRPLQAPRLPSLPSVPRASNLAQMRAAPLSLRALRPRCSCRCSAQSTPTSPPPLASRSASTRNAASLLQPARQAPAPTVSEPRGQPCRASCASCACGNSQSAAQRHYVSAVPLFRGPPTVVSSSSSLSSTTLLTPTGAFSETHAALLLDYLSVAVNVFTCAPSLVYLRTLSAVCSPGEQRGRTDRSFWWLRLRPRRDTSAAAGAPDRAGC